MSIMKRAKQKPLVIITPLMLAAGVLLTLIVVFFWEMFFSGKLPIMRDMFFDFLPQHIYAGELVRAGHLPLWSSYSGWGKPFAADPIAATFYPPHVVFYFLSSPLALRLYCTLHLWIAGIGMFALARHWRLDIAPSLVVAICCTFSSWMVACMEFANNFTSIIWAPLILLTMSVLLDALVESESLRDRRVKRLSVMLVLLFAVQYLAGYPEYVAYTGALVFAYIAAKCFELNDIRLFIRSLAVFFLAGIGALLLTAPQLLLSWEFLRYSERAAVIDPGLQMASIHPRHLLSFILPFINGFPGYPNTYWAGTVFEFWIGTCYVGILPLALALCSVIWLRCRGDAMLIRRRFLCLFLIAAGLFGLLMAFGQHMPFYGLFYEIVPGFSRFRFPSKFLVLVLFSVSLLAGLGHQALIDARADEGKLRSLRRVFVICGVSVFFTLLACYVYTSVNPMFFATLTGGLFPSSPWAITAGFHDFRVALIFVALSVAVLLWLLGPRCAWADIAVPSIVFLNLFIVIGGIQPMLNENILETKTITIPRAIADPANGRVHSIYSGRQQWLYGTRDEELLKWAIQAGVGDSWFRFHVHQTWQGGLKLRRYEIIDSLLGSLPPADSERLADTLGIHYVVGGAQFERILWSGAPRVMKLEERLSARPRAYLVDDWVLMNDPNQIVKTLVILNASIRAIIEPHPSGVVSKISLPPLLPGSADNKGSVISVKDTPNRIEIEVNTKTQSLLVINDAWYPGWQAFVDNVASPIFQTNFHFRGVFVGPGTHKVEMVFDPPLFRLGLGISVVTCIALALLAFYPSKPRKASSSL